jgi:8-oxo-dGTP pyrophosphatase MutT (NUDIX family)
MPPHWRKHSTARIGNYNIFELLRETVESPRTGRTLDAVVLDSADWVNVLAFTEAGQCVLIRQYRFGNERVTLEIPGGMIDPGESPLAAAARELREETGYGASRWTSLGECAPNPAFQRNRLHTFLAEGCERVGAQEQDPGEDIEVVLADEAALDASVRSGEIDHALVLVAFYKWALHRAGQGHT